MLEPYNAHILSAHEHYNENYTPEPHLFEHVHAPLSTLFWQAPWSMDGIPAGYGVYEFDGDGLTWYYKAADHPRSRQFTAYGVGEDRRRPDAVTVNVWNWDPAWQVVWYENGEPRGPMTRYTGYDASIYDYVARYSEHFKHKNIGRGPHRTPLPRPARVARCAYPRRSPRPIRPALGLGERHGLFDTEKTMTAR